jgi:cell division septal protein FtsQ
MGEEKAKQDWFDHAWDTARPYLEQAALPGAILLALVTLHFYVHRYVAHNGGYVVRSETLEKAGVITSKMEDLHLMDETALESLRRKIEARPSVRRVTRLERVYPSSIRVGVERREAWVAIETRQGYTVMDRDRAVMGPATRAIPKTRTGMRVQGVRGKMPKAGETSSDPQVIAAFEMTEIISRYKPLRENVIAIDVSNLDRRLDPTRPDVVLKTRSGCAIHWGRLCGIEREELPEQEKIRNLRTVLRRHPGLRGLSYVKVYIKDRPTIRRADRAGSLTRSRS